MKKQPWYSATLKCLLNVLLFLSVTSFLTAQVSPKEMKVHYINVGQACAALLEFPCGSILIDAGAQDQETKDHLIAYLKSFFQRRTDLNNTLDMVIVSHCHIDHNKALQDVVNTFKVKNYIDNGNRSSSGKKNQKWLQDNASAKGIKWMYYTNEEIFDGGNARGLTNSIIDPIDCDEVNPKITMLYSSYNDQPEDWSESDFENENNQSIVVKIEFGKTSLLFMGDVENKGISTILSNYDVSNDPQTCNILDTDILLVSHHGAVNGTTAALLNAVTPSTVVISCGKWTFGRDRGRGFNTFSYGHPRIATLNLLKSAIHDRRSQSITIKAATAAKKFTNYKVTKKIYATAWDNDIVFRISSSGEIVKN